MRQIFQIFQIEFQHIQILSEYIKYPNFIPKFLPKTTYVHFPEGSRMKIFNNNWTDDCDVNVSAFP